MLLSATGATNNTGIYISLMFQAIGASNREKQQDALDFPNTVTISHHTINISDKLLDTSIVTVQD